MARKAKVEAVGYLRTSSAANVGEDKDSEKRQRAAIESYARRAGYIVVEWVYDKAVRGADVQAIRSAKGMSRRSPRESPVLP